MKNGNPSRTHVWANGTTLHQILQDGRTIAHQRCVRCLRDFAFELDGTGWHAVYVGAFRVELLAEKVNERRVGEECPKKILLADHIDRATRTMSAYP